MEEKERKKGRKKGMGYLISFVGVMSKWLNIMDGLIFFNYRYKMI